MFLTEEYLETLKNYHVVSYTLFQSYIYDYSCLIKKRGPYFMCLSRHYTKHLGCKDV